jgi:uncharacterized damage-inducible protein DinB
VTTSSASAAASADHLDTLYEHLLQVLDTLDDDSLNFTPGVDETNSIAILVAHIVGATARWLSNAAGNPRMGDRPAEFRTRATTDQARALIQQARADARQWFETISTLDPGTERPMLGDNTTTTVAWCVAHAITHAHEHWGQILITNQLAKAGVGTKS